ncbi:MAG: hypothetical protein NTZ10_06815 [Candidatus Saganbacteria bacterium]|nr:hypothetical protein [Candidatus Saganbacteria bacterium]
MKIDEIKKDLNEMFFIEYRGKIYKTLVEALEKQMFEATLDYTNGNKLKSARVLGINRNTLSAKLKKLGLWRI